MMRFNSESSSIGWMRRRRKRQIKGLSKINSSKNLSLKKDRYFDLLSIEVLVRNWYAWKNCSEGEE